MNDTDKRRCIEAFIGKWYVLFFHYYDYARAYESLSKAEDIARNEHDLLPNIWLSFGCMFQALAEQGKEQKHYRIARVTYYTLDGKETDSSNAKGIMIKKILYTNGERETLKVFQ